jgi:hypothetical protein
MLEQIARRLHDAMDRVGTDEDAIYAALAGRSQAQSIAISETFNHMYDPDLSVWLEDELSRDELLHLALVGEVREEAGHSARTVARQLRDAMDIVGTNESAVFAALTGRTAAERTAITDHYHDLTQRNLIDDLREELSGAELTEAIRLFNQGVLEPADELYLAMAGAGTDEDRINRVLSSLTTPAAITAMEADYRAKYGDLVADLRGDLSGGDYSSALGVVGPVIHDVAFEDCTPAQIADVRAAMPFAIQQINRAITILSAGWSSMSAAAQTLFNNYFDRGGSGGVDDRFVEDVLSNFRLIKREMSSGVVMECETGPTGSCATAGIYGYTYWRNVHLCPYFFTMTSNNQSRGIIHELAHNAMLAVDRAYGHEAGFAHLTPRGNLANQIPVFGQLVRAIARDDTLYNPDSYALYAINV